MYNRYPINAIAIVWQENRYGKNQYPQDEVNAILRNFINIWMFHKESIWIYLSQNYSI